MALRTAGIQDTNVLSAIERVPREHFIPEAMSDQAYEDMAVPYCRDGKLLRSHRWWCVHPRSPKTLYGRFGENC